MTSSSRVVLFPVLVLLQPSCHGPRPSPTRIATRTAVVQEGFVEAGGGVRLFYRLVGSGRDTLVVLHGGPGFTMDYLADDLEPLASRHALLFYDQRGAGRSSLVSDSTALDGQRFAEDLEAVRSRFALQRMALLGHSWGAAVAALYASRYPDRIGRLLIVDGIPLRQVAGDPMACHAYYVLWFRPFFADSTAMSRSKGDFCAGTLESRRNKITSVDRFTVASLGAWDWRPSLRRVTAPTLVIQGSADVLPVVGAREWAATLPNGRLLLFEGIGHFPYLEAPERFFTAVDAFLQGSWPPEAQTIAAP